MSEEKFKLSTALKAAILENVAAFSVYVRKTHGSIVMKLLRSLRWKKIEKQPTVENLNIFYANVF